jgi:hypothetical protein
VGDRLVGDFEDERMSIGVWGRILGEEVGFRDMLPETKEIKMRLELYSFDNSFSFMVGPREKEPKFAHFR